MHTYGFLFCFSEDLCDKKSDFVMCPVCDEGCPYWHLSDKCAYSRLAHLFDNDFSVAFAIMMSIWSKFLFPGQLAGNPKMFHFPLQLPASWSFGSATRPE